MGVNLIDRDATYTDFIGRASTISVATGEANSFHMTMIDAAFASVNASKLTDTSQVVGSPTFSANSMIASQTNRLDLSDKYESQKSIILVFDYSTVSDGELVFGTKPGQVGTILLSREAGGIIRAQVTTQQSGDPTSSAGLLTVDAAAPSATTCMVIVSYDDANGLEVYTPQTRTSQKASLPVGETFNYIGPEKNLSLPNDLAASAAAIECNHVSTFDKKLSANEQNQALVDLRISLGSVGVSL